MQVCLTFFSSLWAEFEDDPELYVLKPLKYVGIEVWQVMHRWKWFKINTRSLTTLFS